MTLVQTREKLKPFIDEGVVHKDRKREVKKASDDFLSQKKNVKLEEKIIELKVKIITCIEEKNMVVLEKLIAELANEMVETPESSYIHN